MSFKNYKDYAFSSLNSNNENGSPDSLSHTKNTNLINPKPGKDNAVPIIDQNGYLKKN